jgi:hypothetical protein
MAWPGTIEARMNLPVGFLRGADRAAVSDPCHSICKPFSSQFPAKQTPKKVSRKGAKAQRKENGRKENNPFFIFLSHIFLSS